MEEESIRVGPDANEGVNKSNSGPSELGGDKKDTVSSQHQAPTNRLAGFMGFVCSLRSAAEGG